MNCVRPTLTAVLWLGFVFVLLRGEAVHGQSASPGTAAAQKDFAAVVAKMKAEKPKISAAHQQLLQDRYDLADRPSKVAKTSRGKPIQDGARVKLTVGVTWDALAAMSPDEVKAKNAWPGGSCRCRTPTTPRAGCSSRRYRSTR